MEDNDRAPNIDSVDLKLIRELEIDPRQTNKSLAEKVGINAVTAANRVLDLINAGTLRMVCHVDPVAVGYSYFVTLGIVTQHDRSHEVAAKIAARDRVNAVMLCAGRFNIVAYLMLPSQEDLLDFLSEDLGAIPGIMQVEPLVVLQAVKSVTALLSDGRKFPLARTRLENLDNVDLDLMALLQEDATAKTSALVRKLGVSKATVLRRIQRLEREGIVRFVAEADPISLGYRGVASVYMKFEPDKIKEAARMIASYRNVQYVGITTGHYDVVAWALFRELGDLRRFLVDEIANIPGLKETETMITLKVVKMSFNFLHDRIRGK